MPAFSCSTSRRVFLLPCQAPHDVNAATERLVVQVTVSCRHQRGPVSEQFLNRVQVRLAARCEGGREGMAQSVIWPEVGREPSGCPDLPGGLRDLLDASRPLSAFAGEDVRILVLVKVTLQELLSGRGQRDGEVLAAFPAPEGEEAAVEVHVFPSQGPRRIPVRSSRSWKFPACGSAHSRHTLM